MQTRCSILVGYLVVLHLREVVNVRAVRLDGRQVCGNCNETIIQYIHIILNLRDNPRSLFRFLPASRTCCRGRTLLGITYSEQSTGSRIVIIFQIQVLQQRIRIRVLGGKGLKERQMEKKTRCISKWKRYATAYGFCIQIIRQSSVHSATNAIAHCLAIIIELVSLSRRSKQ